MKLLSWNCRGLGNLSTVRILGDLIKSHNPMLVFLSETLVDATVVTDLSLKFGFVDCFAIDRVGRGGGLAVMWRHNVDCRVVSHSNNHIDLYFNENGIQAWRLSCYYGYPERSRRYEAWDFIRNLAQDISVPWCIFGDFNDMLYASYKKGEHPHPQSLLNGFRGTIDDCNLMELDLKGGDFTWEKCKGKPNWVRERLDRDFATEDWWRKFPLCNLVVHHATKSDHDPIVLQLMDTEVPRKQFRFRFENVWLKEKGFHEEVSKY